MTEIMLKLTDDEFEQILDYTTLMAKLVVARTHIDLKMAEKVIMASKLLIHRAISCKDEPSMISLEEYVAKHCQNIANETRLPFAVIHYIFVTEMEIRNEVRDN